MTDTQLKLTRQPNNDNERGSSRLIRNNSRNNAIGRDFKGAMLEIGGVLCAPLETHVLDRVGYSKFKGLLNSYIFKHMKNAKEIIGSLEKGADPVSEFEKNNAALLSKTIPASGTID